MTAAELFESVTNGGTSDFAALVGILDNHRPWCLIGGLAVNCYVEPVYTVDADIVLVVEEMEKIGPELEKAGFKLQRFEHAMNAQRAPSRLNAQFTTDARDQSFLDTAEEREVLGRLVPAASLENIVRGKMWASSDTSRRASKRKKDELDLLRIAEAYPQLRESIPAEIVAQLQ